MWAMMRSIVIMLLVAGLAAILVSDAIASDTSQIDKIIEKYGYQDIVKTIVDKQRSVTVQIGNEFKVMLGLPDLKYVNVYTILADLERMGISPQKLAELISKRKQETKRNKSLSPLSKPTKADDAEYWYQKGCSLMFSGDLGKALDAFDRATKLNPNHAKAYNIKGVINSQFGNNHIAMESYDSAIKINPLDSTAYHYRGYSYFLLGKYQQSIKDFSSAIEINPKYSEVYCLRGHAFFRLIKYQNAVRDYTKAIELDPKEKISKAYAYGMRGNAYAKMGKYRQAIMDYNKTIELSPQDPEVYYNRATVYGKLGNRKKGFEDLKSAARLGHTKAQEYLRLNRMKW